MNRTICIISLLLITSITKCEEFKILFLNTESIKIGTSTRTVGDVFSDRDKIFWKDGKQAMKVISLETKKQYVLVSEDFKQRKLKSAKDFIVKNNRLSTRGIGNLNIVASQVGEKVYWFNPTLIAIDYEPSDGEYFFLRVKGDDVKLEMEDQQLVLDERIWGDAIPSPTEADLYFQYNDGDNELVNSGILIIPLPNEIQLKKR